MLLGMTLVLQKENLFISQISLLTSLHYGNEKGSIYLPFVLCAKFHFENLNPSLSIRKFNFLE